MIFQRTMTYSLGNPYSIYFRKALGQRSGLKYVRLRSASSSACWLDGVLCWIRPPLLNSWIIFVSLQYSIYTCIKVSVSSFKDSSWWTVPKFHDPNQGRSDRSKKPVCVQDPQTWVPLASIGRRVSMSAILGGAEVIRGWKVEGWSRVKVAVGI